MSNLKFECPACSQHMECDRACAGDIIHCPNCCAEMRIPFPSTSVEDFPRAELILHAPATDPASRSTEGIAAPATPSASSPAPVPHDVQCVCPVCHSELRIPAADAGTRTTAQLVRKAPAQPAPSTPAPAPSSPSHDHEQHVSITEREKQIAEAREAHPVQLYPAMKPRLDYILSGEKPPAEEHPPANDNDSPQQNPQPPPKPERSFPE